ncbi:MAG: alpha/beta hydrolase [Sphingomonas sp.]|nr:alpha/beta hydrolase [Sphingomonas sp.]
MNRTGKWLTGIGAATAALGGGLALWSALGARGAEAAVPQDGAMLDVPGGRLHYVDRGSGMPIVMLHGLLGQLRHFSYALADRLVSDYRVILIDRPGWGYSTVEGAHPGIAQQADMVAALMQRLALEQPVVVGHSMGGALALALAIEHPQLVGALGLIAPLTQVVDTAPDAFRGLQIESPALRALMSWTVAVPMGTVTAVETLRKIFAPDAVPADFAGRGGGALSLRPQSFRAGSNELLAAPEAVGALVPRYGEIAVPTSILYGRQDAILDPELHGRVTANAIPDATLEIITGGHMLPLAHPRATEAWLRRLIARRG